MKISKNDLKALIAEELNKTTTVLLEMPGMEQGYEKDPDGYEGHMAKKALYHMARQADQLHDVIMEDQNLEPWVQAKITKAADYLRSAFDAILYEKNKPRGL